MNGVMGGKGYLERGAKRGVKRGVQKGVKRGTSVKRGTGGVQRGPEGVNRGTSVKSGVESSVKSMRRRGGVKARGCRRGARRRQQKGPRRALPVKRKTHGTEKRSTKESELEAKSSKRWVKHTRNVLVLIR